MQKVIILFGKPGAGKGTRLGEFLEGKELPGVAAANDK